MYVQSLYFDVTSARIVRGRLFTEREGQSRAGVVVVNEPAARRLWPGGEALGQGLRIGGPRGELREVVGVVRGEPTFGVEGRPALPDDARPGLYVPHAADPGQQTWLLVKTQGGTRAIADSVRRDLAGLAGSLRLGPVETLQQLMRRATSLHTLGLEFLGLLGLLATLLAVVGLYGTLAQTVEQRSHELGVRIALGASPGRTLALVLRQGATLAGVGVAIGVPVAIAAERFTRSGFHGVSGTDSTILSVSALAVFFAALTASYLPARRAAKVDPIVALRCE
jgi:putative ABC transport system permease protein